MPSPALGTSYQNKQETKIHVLMKLKPYQWWPVFNETQNLSGSPFKLYMPYLSRYFDKCSPTMWLLDPQGENSPVPEATGEWRQWLPTEKQKNTEDLWSVKTPACF